MRPKMRPVVLLALVAVALGCVSVRALSSRSDLEKCGPYPDEYREIVRSWADSYFSHLNGIRGIQISRPVPGMKSGWNSEIVYGWWTRVKVRGYDRIGMPTGAMQYNVLLRDDAVVHSQKQIQ